MNDVLLTVSGVIPTDINDQIARGERPEADYIAMAREFGADLVDYTLARGRNGRIGRFLEKLGGTNLLLAWDCFKKRDKYQIIFTDGEQIGLPLALFFKFVRRRPAHLMITHILSVGKKKRLIDLFRLQNQIDIFFVYASWQKQFIQSRWNVPAERVVFTPFMVDTEFFQPDKANEDRAVLPELSQIQCPIICAVGLEFRDYPTLMIAVEDLDIHVVIAAASPWSKRSDSTSGQSIPANVTVSRFSQYELRDVYAKSAFMVMPLFDNEFQAGVTALLEAMAMEKAVICSQTAGQTDVIIDYETGLYVPPENPIALRHEIIALLNQPHEAKRMGRNGRIHVEESMSLFHYVKRLNLHVRQALAKSVHSNQASQAIPKNNKTHHA